MPNLYEQAQLLVSLWKLGAADEGIPVSDGVIDQALEKTQHKLPPPLNQMTFSTTIDGLRCLELPDIMAAARELGLIEDADRDGDQVVIIGQSRASQIAFAFGLKVSEAEGIGAELFNQVPQSFAPTF